MSAAVNRMAAVRAVACTSVALMAAAGCANDVTTRKNRLSQRPI